MSRINQMARIQAGVYAAVVAAATFPNNPPTLRGLLDGARRAQKNFRLNCIEGDFCGAEWSDAEADMMETRDAFWSALEAQTGITEAALGDIL